MAFISPGAKELNVGTTNCLAFGPCEKLWLPADPGKIEEGNFEIKTLKTG